MYHIVRVMQNVNMPTFRSGSEHWAVKSAWYTEGCNCVYFFIRMLLHKDSIQLVNTVKLQWLEHLWDYENMFETGVVRANEC